ncbi:MAG: cytochrome-c peroxidase [Verrucomicrobiales bacterium]
MSNRTPSWFAGVFACLCLIATTPGDELPLGLARLDPDEPPPPAAEIHLGEKLFFDKRLSIDGSVSCATCHVPEEAFAQRGKVVSAGVRGKLGRRNSPSLLNVAFAKHLFFDGRSDSLEDQAWEPILAEEEMGNRSVGEVLDRLSETAPYPELFREVFGVEAPDKASVAKALASYQRTLLSGNSRFDQWYWGGEKEAISPLAIEGFNLFSGRALCWQCHSIGGDHGITFTDQLFHNTGVEWRSRQKHQGAGSGSESPAATRQDDHGRFETTGIERDREQYKTPSLRNIALTPPYMHDGSLETLEEVVEFYNLGGGDGSTQLLDLEESDLKAIVAFLECLTGDQVFTTAD